MEVNKTNNINSLEEIEKIIQTIKIEVNGADSKTDVASYNNAIKKLQSLLTTHEQQAVHNYKNKLLLWTGINVNDIELSEIKDGDVVRPFLVVKGAIEEYDKFLEENPSA